MLFRLTLACWWLMDSNGKPVPNNDPFAKPSNAYVWKSSKYDVVFINPDTGEAVMVGVGEADITAKAKDGSNWSKTKVSVKSKAAAG
jgi:hypothetical protein